MKYKNSLDVRTIEKPYRKTLILNLFEKLEDGEQLELISDHSLMPLKKLFEIENQGFFDWEELESGPNTWRIVITRKGTFDLTINELIRQNPLVINIFEEEGIPYYRHGFKRLKELVEDVRSIFQKMKQGTMMMVVNPLRTEVWSISFTIDYIINNHHTYIKKAIPELDRLLDLLISVHSATHPQLPMIKETFEQFQADLKEHVRDEEEIVFPSFKEFEKSIKGKSVKAMKELYDSINWMEEDHILTGTSLKTLRNLCNNYMAPAGSSPGFKLLFDEMRKFELDMHFHIHLENNVLFSKVLDAIRHLKAANATG